jgi:hypothetical protein
MMIKEKKKMNRIITLFVCMLFSTTLFSNCLSEHGEEKNAKNDELRYYASEIPDRAHFCDEEIDLTNYYLRERYDRELLSFSYWHSQIFLMIKRANKYFPVIEPILKAEGIPDDFKYLALIESSLDPRAISPAKAAGIWQILPETAKEYGLEVTDDVDERYHLEKATIVACAYLKKTYEQTGSWSLAAASYNTGRSRVLRQMETQQENNYFDMLFSEETNRYVFRMVLAKRMLANPREFGFYIKKENLYYMIDYDTIEVNTTIENLTDFAKSHGTNYQILKDANPWLRTNKLANKNNKTYYIKVPKQNAVEFDPKKIHVHQKNWVTNP